MMVTGDYHHTALAVARGVGMIAMDQRIVIIQSKAEFLSCSKGSGARASALKSPRPAAQTLHSSRRTVFFDISQQADEEEPLEQLRFQLDNGDAFEDGDALRAFTSIAQVLHASARM